MAGGVQAAPIHGRRGTGGSLSWQVVSRAVKAQIERTLKDTLSRSDAGGGSKKAPALQSRGSMREAERQPRRSCASATEWDELRSTDGLMMSPDLRQRTGAAGEVRQLAGGPGAGGTSVVTAGGAGGSNTLASRPPAVETGVDRVWRGGGARDGRDEWGDGR